MPDTTNRIDPISPETLRSLYDTPINPSYNAGITAEVNAINEPRAVGEYRTLDAANHTFKPFGSYDDYLRADQIQDYVRASNQSVWSQAANGIIGGVASAIGYGLETLPSLAGAAKGLLESTSGNRLASIARGAGDNIVVNDIQSAVDKFKDAYAPVYGSKTYSEGNIIDKLGTTSFWAKDFADGLAFLGSAYLTGYGVNAILEGVPSIGAKAAQIAASTEGRAKLVAGAAAETFKFLKSIGINTRNILTNAINTTFEASQEAKEALNKSNQYYDAKIQVANSKGLLGEAKALEHEKQLTGDKLMAGVFTSNYLLLSLTNIPESEWINGSFEGSLKKSREFILSKLAGKEITPELMEQTYKEAAKNVSILGNMLKGGTLESVGEENPQSAIQNHFYDKYVLHKDNEPSGLSDAIDIANRSVKNTLAFGMDLAALPIAAASGLMAGIKNTFGSPGHNRIHMGMETVAGSPEDDAAAAMMVALPIGAFMSGRHAFKERAAYQQAALEERKAIDSIINLRSIMATRLVDNVSTGQKVYKDNSTVTGEDGKPITTESYVNPETGRPSTDIAKEAQRLHRADIALDQDRIAAQTILNNDELNFNRNVQDALYADVWGTAAFPNLAIDEKTLSQIYDLNPNINGTTAKELGIDGVYKDNRTDIDNYSKLFFKLQNEVFTPAAISNASIPFQNSLRQQFKHIFFAEAGKQAILNAARRSNRTILDPNMTQVSESDKTDDPIFNSTLEELAFLNRNINDFRSPKSKTKDIIKAEVEYLGNLQDERDALLENKARTDSEQAKLEELNYRILEESIKNSNRNITIKDANGKDALLYTETYRQIARERALDTGYNLSSTIREQSKLRLGTSIKVDDLIDRVSKDESLSPGSKLEKVLDYVESVKNYRPFTPKFLKFLDTHANDFIKDKQSQVQTAVLIDEDLDKLAGIVPENPSASIRIIEDFVVNQFGNTFLKTLDGQDFVYNVLELHDAEIDENGTISLASEPDYQQLYLNAIKNNVTSKIQEYKHNLNTQYNLESVKDKLNTFDRYDSSREYLKLESEDIKKLYSNEEEYLIKAVFAKIFAPLYADVQKYGFDLTKDLNNLKTIKNLADYKEYEAALKQAKIAFTSRLDISQDFKDNVLETINDLQDFMSRMITQLLSNQGAQANTNSFYKSNYQNNLAKALGVDLKLDYSHEVLDNDITKIIKEIFPDLAAEFKFLQEQEYDAYAVHGLIAAIKAKATPDQISRLKAAVEDSHDSFANDSFPKYVKERKGKLGYNNYLKYPNKQIRDIIISGSIIGVDKNLSELSSREGNPFYYYAKHGDLFELMLNLKDDESEAIKSIREPILKFLNDFHLPYIGMSDLSNALDSTASYKTIVESIEQVATAKQINLSDQQVISLYQAIEFLTSPNLSTDSYGAGAFLNGSLGSGKSTVASFIIEAMKKVMPSEPKVYALGHSAESTAAINHKLNGTEGNPSYDAILNPKTIEGQDIIIIDEAIAFPNEFIDDLNNAVSEVNKSGKTVKILYVGDISQLKYNSDPHFIPRLNDLASTRGVRHLTPLSVIYRTAIPSIASAILSFRDKQSPVLELITQSTVSNNTYDKNAYGVINMDKETILQTVSNPSSRTRVVITNTDKDALVFANKVLETSGKKSLIDLNLKVLSYYEAAGITTDEAYIMIDRNGLSRDSRTFSNEEFNNAMYTSTGRGSKFLAISPTSVAVNSTQVSGLDDKFDISEQELQNLKESFDSTLAHAKASLNRYFGTKHEIKAPTKTKTEIKPGSKAPIEPIVSGQVTPKVLPKANPGSHRLLYPTNDSVKAIVGDKVHIIQVQKSSSKEEYPTSYLVIGDTGERSSNGIPLYQTLAHLSDGDIISDSLSNYYSSILSKSNKPIVQSLDVLASNIYEYTPEIRDAIIDTLDIDQYTQLTYYYNLDTPKASRTLEDIIQTWEDGYFSNIDETPKYREGNTINFNSEFFQVRIMTNKLKLELAKEGLPITSDWPRKGFPHLIIRNYREKSDRPTPQIIELSAPALNSVPEHFDTVIKPMQEFSKAIDSLEEILKPYATPELRLTYGATHFNAMVTAYGAVAFQHDFKSLQNATELKLRDSDELFNNATYLFEHELNITATPELINQVIPHLNTLVSLSYGLKTRQVVISKDQINSSDFPESHYNFYPVTKESEYYKVFSKPDNGSDEKALFMPLATLGYGRVPIINNNIASYSGLGTIIGGNSIAVERKNSRGEVLGVYAKSIFADKNTFSSYYVALRKALFAKLDFPSSESDMETKDLENEFIQEFGEEELNEIKDSLESLKGLKLNADYFRHFVGIEPMSPVLDDEGKTIGYNLSKFEVDSKGYQSPYSNSKNKNPLTSQANREWFANNTTTNFSSVTPTTLDIKIPALTKESSPQQETDILANKYINNEKAYPTVDVEKKLADLPKHLAPLVQMILPYVSSNDVHVYAIPDEGFSLNYNINDEDSNNHPDLPDKRIALRSTASSKVLLHELIHAVTVDPINRVYLGTDSARDRLFFARLTALQKEYNRKLLTDRIGKNIKLSILDPTKPYEHSIKRMGIEKVDTDNVTFKDGTTLSIEHASPTYGYTNTVSALDTREFIANLSNPKFKTKASEVEFKSTNLLTKLFETIVDFFKVSKNVYDATVETLKDFLTPVTVLDQVSPISSKVNVEATIKSMEDFLSVKTGVDPEQYQNISNIYEDIKDLPNEEKKEWLNEFKDVLEGNSLYRSYSVSNLGNYSAKKLLQLIYPDADLKDSKNLGWIRLFTDSFIKDVISSKDRLLKSITQAGITQEYGEAIKLLWNRIFTDKYKRTIANAYKLETSSELESIDDLAARVDLLSKYDLSRPTNALQKLTRNIITLSDFLVHNQDKIDDIIKEVREDQISEILSTMSAKNTFELINLFGTAKSFLYAKEVVQKKMFNYLSLTQAIKNIDSTLETNLSANAKVLDDIRRTGKQDLLDELNKSLHAKGISTVENLSELADMYHTANEAVDNATGLTKTKLSFTRNALYYAVEEYEHKFRALQVLASPNPKAYESVRKAIFEYWEDKDLKDIDPDFESEDTTNSIYDNLGMKQEIDSNESKNPLSSNIAKIKQFLSTIPINVSESTDEIARFVNPKFAVKRLLEIIPNHIDFNSLYTFGDFGKPNTQLDNLKYSGLFVEDHSTKAILNELKTVVQLATKEIENKTIEVFVDSSKSIARPTVHIIRSTNGADVSYMSPEQARLELGNNVEIYSSKDSDLAKVLSNATKNFSLSTREFNELYIRANAIELIRNFQTTIGSLSTIEYMKGEVNQVFGNQVEFKYYEAKGLGSTQRVNSNIDEAMEKLYSGKLVRKGQKLRLDSKWLTDEVRNLVESSNIIDQKQGLVNFLSIIGYSHLVSKIPTPTFVQSSEFHNMIAGVRSFFNFVVDKIDSTKKKDIEKFIENWQDQGSLKKSIVSFLSSADEVANIDTIIDTKGNKIYTKIPTTSYRITMKLLQEHLQPNKVLRDVDLYNRNMSLSPFNTKFFQYNTFVNGINKVFNYNTRHDGFLDTSYTSKVRATDTTNMSYKEDILVQFGLQYLHTLGLRSDYTYFQPTWQLGEASKREIARVSLLDESKVKESLSSMIDQLDAIDSNLSKNAGYTKGPLNFELYTEAKNKLGPLATKDSIIEEILDSLAKQAIRYTEDYGRLPLPQDIGSIYKTIMSRFSPTEIAARLSRVSEENYKEASPDTQKLKAGDTNVEFYPTKYTDDETGRKLFREHDKNMLTALMYTWVINRYVNSYNLTQLVLGDFNAYKDNMNLAKRSSGSISPGIVPIVHTKFGIPNYLNVFVIDDAKVDKSTTESFLKSFDLSTEELDNILSAYPESYESTDGTSIVTPRFFNLLRKAYGSNYDLRHIMKDQYFGNAVKIVIDKSVGYKSLDELHDKYIGKGNSLINRIDKSYLTHVPVTQEDGSILYYPQMMQLEIAFLKNSIFVVTDDLKRKNPKLKALADFMDSPGTSDITGAPRKPVDILSFKSGNKLGNPTSSLQEVSQSLNDETIGAHTRIIDSRTFKMQYNPYSESNSTALPQQLRYFLNALGTNETYATAVNEAVYNLQQIGIENIQSKLKSRTSISKFVKESISKGSDNFVVAKLIEAGLSIDHPSVEKQGLIALGSAIEKATVRIRIKGNKLSLSSPYGFVNPKTKEALKVKPFGPNGGPIAEALIHADLLDDNMKVALAEGIRIFVAPDMLGFRIPTSEMHSATAIEIVGTHYEDNFTSTIIMPQDLIPIQGWDFDIDSLFLLLRTPFAEDITLNGRQYLKGDYIGYSFDSHYTPDLENTINDINSEITLIEKEIATSQDLKASLPEDDKEQWAANIKAQKSKLAKVKQVQQYYYHNIIVENFLSAVTDPINKSRMLTPISSELFTNDVHNFLQENNILPTARRSDLGLIHNDYDSYIAMTSAARGIGVIANGMKIDAYTRNASKDDSYPTITNKTHKFKLNNRLIESFSEHTDAFGKTLTNYQIKDTVLNLYMDAIKNPVLFPIGFMGSTAALIDTALSLDGFELKSIVLLFNLPYVKDKFISKDINQIFKSIRRKGTDSVDITDEELFKAYSESTPIILSKIDNLLYKLNNISKDRSKIRSLINTGQRQPVTREKLYALEDDVATIVTNGFNGLPDTYQGDWKLHDPFGMDISHFFQHNPQIWSSVNIAKTFKDIVDSNFYIYSHSASTLAAYAHTSWDEETYIEGDQKWKDKVEKHRRVSDFIIRSLVSDKIRNTTPIKYQDTIINKDKAFIYSLMQKIRLVQDEEKRILSDNPNYPANRFINQIILDRFRLDTLAKIKIGDGLSIAPEDYDSFYAEFDRLSAYSFIPVIEDGVIQEWTLSTVDQTNVAGYSEFQRELLDYSLLTNGLRIASNNYNKIIDPVFLNSQAGDVNKLYATYLFKTNLDTYKIPFAISEALDAIESLPYIKGNNKPSGEFEKIVKASDIEHAEAMVVPTTKALPLLIKKFASRKDAKKGPELMIRVHEQDLGEHKIGYYQIIGRNYNYVLFPDTNSVYNVEDHFKTDYPTLRVLSDIDISTVGTIITQDAKFKNKNSDKEIENRATPFKYVVHSNDPTRSYISKAEFKGEVDGKLIYEIVEVDLARPKQEVSVGRSYSNDNILYNEEVDSAAEELKENCKGKFGSKWTIK